MKKQKINSKKMVKYTILAVALIAIIVVLSYIPSMCRSKKYNDRLQTITMGCFLVNSNNVAKSDLCGCMMEYVCPGPDHNVARCQAFADVMDKIIQGTESADSYVKFVDQNYDIAGLCIGQKTFEEYVKKWKQ